LKPTWVLIAVLLALGTGWGSSQSTGKLAVSTGHQPFTVIFWQLAISTLLLGAIAFARGKRPSLTPGALRFYVVVAVLGTLIPNLTFYLSVRHLSAGVMSILISLVPILAWPMAVALGMDRFSGRRLVGLGLGLSGVALIAWAGGAVGTDFPIVWFAVALIGPLFYAMEGTYVARRGAAGMDPVTAMFGASAMGLCLCVPILLVTGQAVALPMPFGVAEWAIVIQSIVHAFLYSGYVWLAIAAGPVFASQTSYMVTATGMFWAMVIMGERFPPLVWVALVVMLAGVALVRPRGRVAG